MTAIHSNLEAEAKRIEEDCIYTAKSHFSSASRWNKAHYALGVPATLFAAAAGAAVTKDWNVAGSLLALFSSLLAGLVTFLKPSDQASKHKSCGDFYLALRNDTRIFRTIDLSQGQHDGELTKALKSLARRRDELNQSAPHISRTSFEQGRRSIEAGEATHSIDKP